MTGFRGQFISSETIARGQWITNYLSTGEYDRVDFTDGDNFFNALTAKVNVARVEASKGRNGVTLEYLSQKWLISQEETSRTVQNTTQRGIRTILHP